MTRRVLKDAWQGEQITDTSDRFLPLAFSEMAQPVGLDDKIHDFLPRPYPVTQQGE